MKILRAKADNDMGDARVQDTREKSQGAGRTGSVLEKVSKLTPEQQALLSLRLKKKAAGRGAQKPKTPPLLTVERNASLPLSFAQQRLWFLDQLEPGNTVYNLLASTALTGRLDVEALERSLNEIVRRHESLRTTFKAVNGRPIQLISRALELKLERHNIEHLPESARQSALKDFVGIEAQRPFDLSTGPLLRASLVRVGEQHHVLLLVMHHIISDGWSLGVLFRELTALYETYCAEAEPALEKLAIQYADYAVWQREWLQGEVLEEQLGYWREQLAGAPAVLELPTDRPRPPVQSQHGAMRSFVLSREVTAKLRELSRREDATLFMTLLAAWQTLLYRYSGQEDIVVGSPIAGRNHAEVEALIGFFVNTLVLRARLRPEMEFRELLGQVREVCLGAYAHQDLPFERLVEELQPERTPSHSPLFQVTFTLQNEAKKRVKFQDLTLSPVKLAGETAAFDLTLSIRELDDELNVRLRYKTDLFDDTTIQRMTAHFERLLESIVANPQQKLSEIALLSAEERQQLLVEWNDTQAEFPSDICVHELFEAQATRTPNAIAVVYEDQQLTYGELNEKANQLAHHLRELGVREETLVGICVERSVEMVIGLLGVLKAGGAYLPIDPSYPQERLRFMLDDARVSVLLTQRSLVETLPPHRAHVLTLDADLLLSAYSTENPASVSAPDNLCYVIYTSGSTGQPKGVAVTHSSLVNLVCWHLRTYNLAPGERTTQMASPAFDAAAWEIWPALAGGCRLLVVGEAERSGGRRLWQWLEREGARVSFAPTPVAETLLAEAEGTAAGEGVLRTLLTGGDRLRVWSGEAMGGRLVNHYGPTEATVVTTSGEVAVAGEGVPPIGRPIDNAEVYVVDKEMRAVPVGVAGELLIGGAVLARGYVNRAELTAERFVPHPYAKEAGARVYRTGDVVRYLRDGQLEFLGRRDEQVKVRGFRIELGEIEAALGSHGGVRECVVVAREDEGAEKRLVAYVVAAEAGEGLNVSELREHLRERLPEYMVPVAFVAISAIPLTSNGKVNRLALASLDHFRPDLRDAFVAPRTPLEEMLCGIWSEVLRIELVGINDNFFELGGHSLLATQVISRVRDAFRTELPLRSIFEAPTIAGLAERIAAAGDAQKKFQASPVMPVLRDSPLPLSFGQQRLWFLGQLDSESSAYNLFWSVILSGELNLTALERSLNEVIRRHESLRTTFTMSDGQPVQVISPDLHFTLTLTDLTHLPADQREAAARAEVTAAAQRPFDLSTGPLLRAGLVRMDEQEHVLLLVMHHIISDGWSLGVLFRELTALYEGYTRGEESQLEELAIQYADYAVWQREWLQGEVLEEQLGYWREQLAGAPAVLELPTDRPRPPVQSYSGGRQTLKLNERATAGLRELSRREDVTLFMTLLSAWQTLLYRYSGQEDIVVGSPIAGRNRAEVEELIGFFVNTLVLRARLNPRMEFRELLKQVREVCLGAYAHQEMPFERLVEELQPARSLSYSPLFQVLFVLQNTPAEKIQFESLTLKPLKISGETAKFDLVMSVNERVEELILTLRYNSDLFAESTINRMMRHFELLLEGIITDPQQKLSEIPLLGAEERQQLLVEWNDTQAAFPTDKCIHELFEEQVARTPDAIAVAYEEQQLSYRELNERANQLAHHLRELGVVPETLVGLCVERSIEMIVGLLGILKAGGAYLPLDPSYPQERLRFMLDDAHVSVLLTQHSLVETLPPHSAQVLTLDTDWPLLSAYTTENLASVSASDNLCYVIYTSGSTGWPKGVMIRHRSVINLSAALRQAVYTHASLGTLAAPLRVSLNAPLAFDASVKQLVQLLDGHALYVLPDPVRYDARLLHAYLSRHRIDVLDCTPSQLRLLLPVADAAGSSAESHFPGLVLTGGEALDEALWAALAARAGVCFYNVYGPTECTVDATACRVGAGSEWASIGRPLGNMSVYVLDGGMGAVAVGVAGELHIGGEGVGRGYLRRAELTAERFVPDPYSKTGGQRLYKTGDVCRYREDGRLEYVGRVDEQVKVRGFRIELGEIEAALGSHGSVRECVVVARAAEEGEEKRLVAYVVAQEGKALNVGELREHVRERLPEYMIPGVFVALEGLPLTANGKVDKRALPAPDSNRLEAGDEYVAPRTPVEEVLCGIWSQVLKVERVGVEDNFFALGGHSLLATQVISRVREALQVELPLRSLFERPTASGMAEAVSEQQDIGIKSLPLVRVSRQAQLPLSFAQERLWFIDQLELNKGAYYIPRAIRMSGQLDLTALEHSLNEVIRRHESLRTTFTMSDGQPVQVIAPHLHLSLSLTDLSHLPADQREAEARAEITAAAQRPFDLSTGPLLRAELLRLSEQEHVLLLVMHHIISDGWSLGVLFRELTSLYEGYTRGEESQLEELAIQYADYAVWQREWLQGEVLEEQLSYWREQLAGTPALLELPTDRPRPAVQSQRGAVKRFVLTEELSEKLKELSRREDVTLFMTLLAAWQTLLYRYSGQEDIVVGSPIAGRNRAELEELIGFFINTLVLRARLDPRMEFRELLKQVREVCLGAYAHQEMPFERLVEELQPARSLSHSPLFQVMFALQNTPFEGSDFSGLTREPFGFDGETAQFDLSLSMSGKRRRLSGLIEYNADIFDEATIGRLARHFETLLESLVADPAQRLAEAQLLTRVERQRLLIDWNETRSESALEKCIAERFEAQVERSPEAVAVVGEGEQLTYRELNERANQLAHYLRRRGVGAESLVGLCVERSVEMVVGLLGILKAGGAYLPLDPTYPQERLRFMLEDSGVSVLLTHRTHSIALPPDGLTTVRLDADRADIATESNANLSRRTLPDHLAYVIYTSGSTGTPKGVLTTQRGLSNHCTAVSEVYRLASPDRVLQFASISFDVAAEELFPTLLSGAAVVLLSGAVSSFRDLLDFSETRQLTVVNLPTPYWHELVGYLSTSGDALPASLRLVVIGSDQAVPKTVETWRGLAGDGVALINAYGPTETTITATVCDLGTHPNQQPLNNIPIGRPLSNVQAYILNEFLQPVPVGVAGELFLGGEGVARGYLGRPALTAERFIPHPFSHASGQRLYATGDVCRQLDDGRIEFLGRSDEQVKVRGFRIELGEVEAAINEQAGVRECVVVAREQEGGEKRLVAYVVGTEGGAEVQTAELREQLRGRLPEYMVPGVFVWLERLPLTANGKVDRRALPAPEHDRAEREATYVAPRTCLEEVLAGIWAELLELEQVGIRDNFFEIGGHSLMAMRLLSHIRESIEVQLPLRCLFEAPTVEQQAEAIFNYCDDRARVEKTAQLLIELAQLSEDEMETMLLENASPVREL